MGEDQTAVPPVRLREFTEAFTQGNMFSVCSDNYAPALEAIADKIIDQIVPACYKACVKDTDLASEILVPDCAVKESAPGASSETNVEECLKDGSGYVMTDGDYTQPSPDSEVCYALLLDDSGATSDQNDDISEYCADEGWNLEFKIARTGLAPAGTAISAVCQLSDFGEECPASNRLRTSLQKGAPRGAPFFMAGWGRVEASQRSKDRGRSPSERGEGIPMTGPPGIGGRGWEAPP